MNATDTPQTTAPTAAHDVQAPVPISNGTHHPLPSLHFSEPQTEDSSPKEPPNDFDMSIPVADTGP